MVTIWGWGSAGQSQGQGQCYWAESKSSLRFHFKPHKLFIQGHRVHSKVSNSIVRGREFSSGFLLKEKIKWSNRVYLVEGTYGRSRSKFKNFFELSSRCLLSWYFHLLEQFAKYLLNFHPCPQTTGTGTSFSCLDFQDRDPVCPSASPKRDDWVISEYLSLEQLTSNSAVIDFLKIVLVLVCYRETVNWLNMEKVIKLQKLL